MKNVYDQVQLFYEEDSWTSAVKREWVEGYLRQKAWQGADDKELTDDWRNLEMFLQYLTYAGHSYSGELEVMPPQEYSQAVTWMGKYMEGFNVTLKPVKKFFSVLLSFYQYLAGKKIINNMGLLQEAAQAIAGGSKLDLNVVGVDPMLPASHTIITDDWDTADDETVETLMNRLGDCFQQEQFIDDFERAMLLYSGPMQNVPDDEYDEFWLGFWDYFLFDYHLLNNDDTPLTHFYKTYKENVSVEERRMLEDLLQAQFTVFYITRVINQDWVDCVNLFTGEHIKLPHPDFDYKKMKKLIFYGHVFSEGMVIVNYVTSMEISPKLRRRIKEEVTRQKEIFSIQVPGATWEEFFSRHAITVRHTFDVFGTMAKVNVTPFNQMERVFPEIAAPKAVNQDVMVLLSGQMRQLGFSAHDVKLAGQLWHQFNQLNPVVVRKPAVWAAATVHAYSAINASHVLSADSLAEVFGVSASSVYTNRNRLYKVLELEKFDPRFLSEEGFLFSLFST
ncbi:Hypothetical protein LUCI_3943 [Lucifera butyrica]|uniref:Core-binding (CB) domain-containing protein n=1 Tax=Lucifera butyrica TaxID=1351585 RepID=A0A498RCC9_9FIRM|nr:hypothetical protein [Lucifera butyrica]VBB08665.1 Hypothetical protein LUCI_3943 [Lucifera butyrica]